MSDLTREEVLRIAERVDRALERRSVLPIQSLQYRLGEVENKRVHPHALRRLLNTVSRPVRSKSTVGQELQPWVPYPNVYVSPSLSASEARAAAERQQGAIEKIGAANWGQAFDLFVEAVHQSTGQLTVLREPVLDHEAAPLAYNVAIRSESRILRHEGDGVSPVHLWITQDTRWIHPDDHRLWAFLASCLEAHAMPLIIARLIDPATFPLFKALGVRGMQYYGMWSTEEIRKSLGEVTNELGWFYLNSAEKAREHRIFEQLPRSLESLSGKALHHPVSDSIQEAIGLGLAAPGPDATTRLLTWAESTELPLPEAWQETLERWITWQNGSPVQRPKLSRKKTLRDGPPAAVDSGARHQQPATTPVEQAPATDEPRGFGRKTTITRVPLRLR
jgi:hypothetical protein